MSKEQSFRATAKRSLDGSIRASFCLARRAGAGTAYERVLRHVQTVTSLLRPMPSVGRGRTGNRNLLNCGLLNLALHRADWLRPVETWAPPPGNPWPLFRSLAQHLFANYPVPACLISVWLKPPSKEACRQQGWFKHLGLGGSLRTADLPIPLTRAMAHCFGQAPAHFSVEAGLRWAQVRGLGGPPSLARAVAATRLGKEFQHEDFWLTVLQFLVNHPKLDPGHVGPIVDFLHHQRFVPQEVFVGGVLVRQRPPRPDYSIKGRTVQSLLRQVEEWHKHLGKECRKPARVWGRSKIREFEVVEGCAQEQNMRRWTIRELLTSQELLAEGRALRHCVASYAAECAWRHTSIWSLRLENDTGERRVLTIEVDPATRTICQVRGKANRPPKERERGVLHRWVKREGLRMAESP